MTPQELKNSILQLAIQGKLVPQDPSEGTGEELYHQIQAEKAKLIASKLIKDDMTIPEPDAPPFDIPDSWIWARITDCGSFISGYTPKPNQLADFGTVPYFKVADMNTKGNELFLTVTNSFLSADAPQKYYLKNSIVYPKNGGAVFTNKKRILSVDSVVDLNTGGYSVIGPVFLMYFYYFFSLIDFRQCYKGTALPTLDMDKLKSKLVPLPPLAEQKRIVAKIEELLPLIDRYEEAWTKLEEFNKRFPMDMQKSILQMAIQGKLVPQDLSEGTGEELYRQIQAEKTKLVKEGRIKKDKPLAEITEDEIPFEIPESWKWVHVGELFQHNTGKALNSSDKEGTPMEYITTSNVYWNRFEFGKLKTMLFTEAEIEKCTVQKGDLLVLEGGDIGRAAIWNYDYPMRIQNHIHRLRRYAELSIKFFYYIFFLYKNAGLINGKGIAIQGLSASILHSLAVPLPPLAEQKRIVAKLEEILPLCERLE
jgi:type I restriction enzyme S subunit